MQQMGPVTYITKVKSFSHKGFELTLLETEAGYVISETFHGNGYVDSPINDLYAATTAFDKRLAIVKAIISGQVAEV
jgi:hypothetical protein